MDGYAGYNRLIAPDRVGPNIRLAYCWAHARRKLVEITRTGSAPLIADMRTWLTQHRVRVADKSPLGEALAYIAKYWDSLCVFLTDGRIEIDNNTVERTIRRSQIDALTPWNYSRRANG